MSEQPSTKGSEILNSLKIIGIMISIFLIIWFISRGIFPTEINVFGFSFPLETSTPIKDTLSPTTETNDSSPIQQESSSSVYDNFEDSRFDDSLNSTLWGKYSTGNSVTAYQNNGSLILKTSTWDNDNGAIFTFNEWTYNYFSLLEARVKLISGSRGGNFTLNIDNGKNVIEFGPQAENNPYISVSGNGNQYGYHPIEYDKWYTLKFKTDWEKSLGLFYVDNVEIGRMDLQNISSLKPTIQLWYINNGTMEIHIDYINIE